MINYDFFKSIFCKQYTVWILIFLVGNNLRTAFGNNCISNQPNVTYYYDGNNENAEFDLLRLVVLFKLPRFCSIWVEVVKLSSIPKKSLGILRFTRRLVIQRTS